MPATTLKLRRVREVFRLVGEIREIGSDPSRWRPHLVRRLSEMLAAEIVTSSELHFRRLRSGVVHVLDVGWGSDAAGGVWEIRSEQDQAKPETYMLAVASDESPPEENLPVKILRPVYGGQSFILSQYALPHIGAVDQLGVHRAADAGPFSPADHKLVRLFHVELGRLWKRDALKRAQDPQIALPPRLKETLDALVTGFSEKQIASKLKLSPHTIHNYVKALHQRFKVSSRGELLARVNSERESEGFTPRLSIPPR